MMASAAQLASDKVNSPINRLPTEVITLILQSCLLLDSRTSLQSESLYRGGGLNYYKELSLVCYVCKRWQSIIETNPGFWISISTSLPPLLSAKIVKRAPGGRSLLVECFPIPSSDGSNRLQALGAGILQLSKSWTSLHVQLATPAKLLQFLTQPVPRLRKLHLEYSQTVWTLQELESALRTISLPLDILKVNDSIFPWGFSGIANLVEIDIECHTSCPHFVPTLQPRIPRCPPRFTWSHIPRLWYCQTDFQPILQSSTITLPHLASIDIKDSSAASGLLKAIICPPSTKISICEQTGSPTLQNPWVIAALAHTNFECSDKVYLKFRPDIGIGAAVGNLNLELQTMGHTYEEAAITQFHTDFLKPFSETNGVQVTTLELELDFKQNSASLISKLASFFPNITSLELRCYDEDPLWMSDSFDALSRPSEEDDAHQSLFPRMEKLAVDWGECYDDLANSVMDMIRSRSHPQGSLEAGAGEFSLPQPTYLRELHLKGCRMSRDQAEELEHVFGNAVKFDSVRVRIPS